MRMLPAVRGMHVSRPQLGQLMQATVTGCQHTQHTRRPAAAPGTITRAAPTFHTAADGCSKSMPAFPTACLPAQRSWRRVGCGSCTAGGCQKSPGSYPAPQQPCPHWSSADGYSGNGFFGRGTAVLPAILNAGAAAPATAVARMWRQLPGASTCPGAS
jgi:hypothetical protein